MSGTTDEKFQKAREGGARFQTKDSGKRAEYESGMVRDTEDGKARFDLLLPKGVPYANQMLTRFAELMARGAAKYDPRNWEKADGEEELERYRSSALRHLIQWVTGEDDEDHAAAVMFNLLAGETVKFKIQQKNIVPRPCGSPTCRTCYDDDLPGATSLKEILEELEPETFTTCSYAVASGANDDEGKCGLPSGHDGKHWCEYSLSLGLTCYHDFVEQEMC